MAFNKETLRLIKSHKSTLMTIGAVVGVGVTAYTSFKAGMQIEKLKASGVLNDNLKAREKLKICLKTLGKPYLCMIGTLVMVVGSHNFSEKQKRVLRSILSDQQLAIDNFRTSVKTTVGDEKYKETIKRMVKEDPDKVLLYDTASNRYIETSFKSVLIDDDVECYIVDLDD